MAKMAKKMLRMFEAHRWGQVVPSPTGARAENACSVVGESDNFHVDRGWCARSRRRIEVAVFCQGKEYSMLRPQERRASARLSVRPVTRHRSRVTPSQRLFQGLALRVEFLRHARL